MSTFKPKEQLIEIMTEGQFVWYTRNELKKLSAIGQGAINDAINDMIRMKVLMVKGGNGLSNPKKYALRSRVNGEIVQGSKVISIKPLKDYHNYLFSKMHLCNSTR
jgi:hypothetical protein